MAEKNVSQTEKSKKAHHIINLATYHHTRRLLNLSVGYALPYTNNARPKHSPHGAPNEFVVNH